MAGTRQHIVPRFLLKGFASRMVGDEIYTWVCRSDGSVFEANITKIAVQRHYYGREGEQNADVEISEIENKYSPFIDRLREMDTGEITDVPIAEIIAHLCVRTKHLRESFRDSVEYLVDAISKYVTDSDNVKTLILNNPKLIEDEIIKELIRRGVSEENRHIFLGIIRGLVPSFLEYNKEGIKAISSLFIDAIRRMIPSALKSGHIKVLHTNPVPEPRAEDYRNLRWHVVTVDRTIILGDAIVLFEIDGERRFKTLNDHDDKISNVFLPISYSRVVVGTSDKSLEGVYFNINEAIARCSREYFVCSDPTAEVVSLQSVIGADSSIISKTEMDQIITEMFQFDKTTRDG